MGVQLLCVVILIICQRRREERELEKERLRLASSVAAPTEVNGNLAYVRPLTHSLMMMMAERALSANCVWQAQVPQKAHQRSVHRTCTQAYADISADDANDAPIERDMRWVYALVAVLVLLLAVGIAWMRIA